MDDDIFSTARVSDEWRRAICWHPDAIVTEDGHGICPRCGAAVEPADPIRDIKETMHFFLRQAHGHLVACIESGDDWLCPPECPTRRHREGTI